jgi:hypothetical protein
MAFSPDGRLLALGGADGMLRVFLAATARELRSLPGHRSGITCLAFAPDGKALASGSRDTTALIWDVADLLKRQEATDALTTRQLETLWTHLASDNAAGAYRAMQQLADAPGQTVPYLKAHLRPVPVLEPKQLAPLFDDLDSEDFRVREKASIELEKLDQAVEPMLRAALDRPLSPEASRRIRSILAKWDGPPSPERLRELRALEVLERIDNARARELLKTLAQGAAQARLTRDARASLERRP